MYRYIYFNEVFDADLGVTACKLRIELWALPDIILKWMCFMEFFEKSLKAVNFDFYVGL